MRISDVNSGSKTGQTKRKKIADKTGGVGAFSDVMGATSEESEVVQTPGVGNINSVLSIDSLGILSNINNEEQVKKHNIEWGKDILKVLEGLKYQILNGKISYGSLVELKQRLNNIPLNTSDFKLKRIIEEIETRAAVELEKYRRLSEQTKVFKDL